MNSNVVINWREKKETANVATVFNVQSKKEKKTIGFNVLVQTKCHIPHEFLSKHVSDI